jgi:hypothetical protein
MPPKMPLNVSHLPEQLGAIYIHLSLVAMADGARIEISEVMETRTEWGQPS